MPDNHMRKHTKAEQNGISNFSFKTNNPHSMDD